MTVPRVAITGLGIVSPLGTDAESTWSAIRNGRSGLRVIPGDFFPDPNGGRGCYVGGPSPLPIEIGLDPTHSLASHAAREAMTQAFGGADRLAAEVDPERVGIVVGTSKGGLHAAKRAGIGFRTHGGFEPEEWFQLWPSHPAERLRNEFQTRGPLLCPVAACATGLIAIIRGAELIRQGTCDVVLAGSVDASLLPEVLSFFSRIRVLSNLDVPPEDAVRPYDRSRAGFLVGEGAGMLVLERADHATARGRMPLAEWLAGGLAADPSGLTQLDPDADGLASLIRTTLHRAEVPPDRIGLASLHGTATRANDRCESAAIAEVFGTPDRSSTPHAVSFKGHLGHLLGAAGSVETALTVLALRDRHIPRTANLHTPADDCPLRHPNATGSRFDREHALKLSLGFGGHLAAGVLSRWRGA